MITAIRIMAEFQFPSETMRLWDGSAPFLDSDGNVWFGTKLTEGLDQIESALNGEASTLELFLDGVSKDTSDLAHEDLENDEVIGATVRLMIQPCDRYDQPEGDPEVRFTGTINNMLTDDVASQGDIVSRIRVEVTNRFNLRTLVSGAVLSDVDQRARSAILNPGADPDRFAERISGLSDQSVVWPRYS